MGKSRSIDGKPPGGFHDKQTPSSRPVRRFQHPHGRKRLYTTGSRTELLEFAKGFELIMSHKLAGQPVTLTYTSGQLIMADYCNDGTTGYDITSAMALMGDVPTAISDPHVMEVRGAVVLSWQAYAGLTRSGEYPPSDNEPHALAKKLAASADMTACAASGAEFIAYDMSSAQEYEKKSEILEHLRALGFKVVEYWRLEDGLTPAGLKTLQRAHSAAHSLYPAEGLVFETEALFTNCFDPDARRIMALTWPLEG